MSAIYYKTVKGRKYAYRCLGSWRDDAGKVHKQEEYLGPVEPVNRVPIMHQIPYPIQKNIRAAFVAGEMSVPKIRDYIDDLLGNRPSASTVYNFLRGADQ